MKGLISVKQTLRWCKQLCRLPWKQSTIYNLLILNTEYILGSNKPVHTPLRTETFHALQV